MKLIDIVAGKKYLKYSASLSRRRGIRTERIKNTVYVLSVDISKKMVLASINAMPAQWHNQSSYATWTEKNEL